MHDEEDVRALVGFLLARLEADPEEILEWFFMEHRVGVERRQFLEGLVAESLEVQ